MEVDITMEYDIALIQQTNIFKDLSAFKIKQIFEGCASLKDFEPGEKIIEEGGVDDDLYFVPKGKVQVELELGHDQCRQVNTIQGPVVLGEISFLDKSPRSATIIPAESLCVYVIDGSSLDELLEEMPHTGHKIKHNIALSVAKTVRHLNDLISREMQKSRLLHKKAAELGSHRYNEAITNLAYHIHLSV
ncbi:MAG: cyclic nucleotide-binding domain-containing protein [Desulfobacteraceae bacterium]|nr:cyclic nucleotide-binding domain-containing protein [Desulfobacteraceae bacterium]